MDKRKERPLPAQWPSPLSPREIDAACDDYLNELGIDALSLLTLDELHSAIIKVFLQHRSDPQPLRHGRRLPEQKVPKRQHRRR
jgi:hypothetical protein